MVKIALICNGGISASILMKKIRMEADAIALEVHIEAVALQNITLLDKVDVLLLSPQTSYAYRQVQSYTNLTGHVLNVSNFDYSSLNAKKIVQDIRDVVEKEDMCEKRNS